MPNHLDEELIVTLKDQALDIELELHYLISNSHDVIVRNTVLINNEKEIKEAIKRAEEDREMLGQYYQFVPSSIS